MQRHVGKITFYVTYHFQEMKYECLFSAIDEVQFVESLRRIYVFFMPYQHKYYWRPVYD